MARGIRPENSSQLTSKGKTVQVSQFLGRKSHCSRILPIRNKSLRWNGKYNRFSRSEPMLKSWLYCNRTQGRQSEKKTKIEEAVGRAKSGRKQRKWVKSIQRSYRRSFTHTEAFGSARAYVAHSKNIVLSEDNFWDSIMETRQAVYGMRKRWNQ